MADDTVRVHPAERLDIEDAQPLADLTKFQAARLGREMVTGDGKARILSGFDFTVAAATPTKLDISIGSALVGLSVDGDVRFGELFAQEPSSQSITFSDGASLATVWARLQVADGATQNRAFWDTVPATDTEVIRTANTRRVATWAVALSASSPGEEWFPICLVAWNGTSLLTSTISDRRRFLFEGDPASTPVSHLSTWGSVADRNNTRGNGIATIDSLERFAQFVHKKFAEIQSSASSSRSWLAPAVALDEKVSKIGDVMTGELKFLDADLDGQDLWGYAVPVTVGPLTAPVDAFRWTGTPDPGFAAADQFMTLLAEQDIAGLGGDAKGIECLNGDGRHAWGLAAADIVPGDLVGVTNIVTNDASTSGLTPSRASLVLRNRTATTNTRVGMLFDFVGDAGADGAYVFATRPTDDNPEFHVAFEIDGAVQAVPALRLRLAELDLDGLASVGTHSTAADNIINKRNIPKAWANIVFDGAGQVATDDGFNVLEATFPGGGTDGIVRLPFSKVFATIAVGATYAAVATGSSNGTRRLFCSIRAQNESYVDIEVSTTTGANMDVLDFTSDAPGTIHVVTFGLLAA